MFQIIFKSTLLLFFSLALGISKAQRIQQKEIKFKIDNKLGDDYILIPHSNNGVLCLHNQSSRFGNNKRSLHYTMLDTSLNKKWEFDNVVDSNLRFIESAISKKSIWLLFSIKEHQYEVHKFDIEQETQSVFEINEVRSFNVSFFQATEQGVYLGGKIRNNPAVLFYDAEKNHTSFLPGINQLNVDLINLKVDPSYELLFVLLQGPKIGKDNALFAHCYNSEGQFLYNYAHPQNVEYSFITAFPFTNTLNEHLLVGTYSLRNDDLAQGIYTIKLLKGNEVDKRFYDFGYFNNFFNYLPEKQKSNLLKKIERKREKDKVYTLKYKLFTHEPRLINDKILFMAESIEYNRRNRPNNINNVPFNSMYPYRSFNRFYNNFNYLNWRRYMPSTIARYGVNNFNATDYEYEHAFVCSLNLDGKLLWDNSYTFEKGTEYDTPLELIEVGVSKESLAFIEPSKENIKYAFTKINSPTDSTSQISVSTIKEKSKITDFEHGGILHWYSNNFIHSGIRKVINSTNTRVKYFFINKISAY